MRNVARRAKYDPAVPQAKCFPISTSFTPQRFERMVSVGAMRGLERWLEAKDSGESYRSRGNA
jgi:hypothetical protein